MARNEKGRTTPPKPRAERCSFCGRKKKLKLKNLYRRYDPETGEEILPNRYWKQVCPKLLCEGHIADLMGPSYPAVGD